MEIVAGIAGLFTVITCWVISARLILLSRRTGRVPELLIGLGLLLLGGLWNPLISLGRQMEGLPEPTRVGLVVAGALCGVSGMVSLSLFTRRVFRPDATWAGVAIVVLGAALLAAFTLQGHANGWVVYVHEERGAWLAATWIGSANYVWATLEAWLQQRQLARRQRLGLVDPVVLDRVRIWCLMMLVSAVASAGFGTFQLLGVPVAGTVLGLCATAVVATVSSACLLLAFLPPAAYLERVRSRAAAAPVAAA